MNEIKMLPAIDFDEWVRGGNMINGRRSYRGSSDPSTWVITEDMMAAPITEETVPTDSVNNATEEPSLKSAETKGRGKRKLTEDDVREIRARSANGEKNGAIAKDYEVTHACVYNILKGNSWKHVK